MKIIRSLVLSGVLIAGSVFLNQAFAQQKDNTLTKKEKKQGWQLLFDGNSTSGWHSYNQSALGSAWNVEDGALHLNKKSNRDGGDAVTNEEFGDFDLKLDWKISPNGNSGIMFLVKEDPKYERSYYTGPEMQVLDNNGHPDAKIIKHRAGDLYDLITSSPENVKPVGEWNSVEIKLKNSQLELWQNGVKVVSTTLWDENWNKLVAGSKFKNMEDFAKFRSGRIVLQDHGNEVWFKNIRIRKL
ncbi:MAG: DUF1080 domain-containing protein [Chitinophagaceae bacterium]|nr:DUF1080 domain-containing protein [Chitinophagaceae bacterium]